MEKNTQDEKSLFEVLEAEVQNGLEGKNEGISFGFPRLDNYINLRKSTLYLFGGYTGSGKTTCADEIFVLNPFDNLYKQGLADRLHITYWSMERKTSFKLAKWFARKCFLDEGIRIPMERLIGWVKKEKRLTKDEHDLFLAYREYFDALQECVTIFDGRQNPTGIRKYVRNLAEKNGEVEKVNDYKSIFHPKDPSKIFLHIFDHAGKLKKEQKMSGDKELIDTFSDDVSNNYRDFYGHSSVIVSQFNRNISNPMRLKQDDVTPMLEDFKSTSDMAEDADVVLSIFDPWRYKVNDPSGYDLDQLRDSEGSKYYRNFQILKNSFGKEDVRIGLAYEPSMGIFREMPKRFQGTDISPEIYNSIIQGSYFLQ